MPVLVLWPYTDREETTPDNLAGVAALWHLGEPEHEPAPVPPWGRVILGDGGRIAVGGQNIRLGDDPAVARWLGLARRTGRVLVVLTSMVLAQPAGDKLAAAMATHPGRAWWGMMPVAASEHENIYF